MLSLYLRFKLVPSTKALFVPHLAELMKTMANEPTFVSAVLSEDADAADELVLFEVWNGSLDQWLVEQPKKPYRAIYEDATKGIVADKEVRFLSTVVLQN
ncbi:antibiotic biosynthesis monooxygenase [Paraburkholderia sp. BR13444]|uniref:antibiotic biosynthesis monooxygenase n=1 Tax=Paraburkholderia sp. BR13444 TaxID=3236997 RepID=UPI0034CDE7AA